MSDQKRYFVGTHEFKRRQNDELDIHKGDYVELIEDDSKFGDSWYVGRNLTTGQTGLFPKAFTKPIARLPEKRSSSGLNDLGSPERRRLHSEGRSPSYASSSHSRDTTSGSRGTSPMSTQPSHQSNSIRSIHGNSTSTSALSPIRTNSGHMSHTPLPANGKLSRLSKLGTANHERSDSDTMHSAAASLSHTMTEIDEALSEIAAATPPLMDRVGYWSPYEVRAYFLSRGYDQQAAERFVSHQIVGSTLLELDLPMLKELGIASFGTRFEISKDIKQLALHVKESGQEMPDSESAGVALGGPRTPQTGHSWPSPSQHSNSGPGSANLSTPTHSTLSNRSPATAFATRSPAAESKPERKESIKSINSTGSVNHNRLQSVVDFPYEAVTMLDDSPDTPPLSHSRSVSELVNTALSTPETAASITGARSSSQGDAVMNKVRLEEARAKAHRRHSSIPSVLGDVNTPPPSSNGNTMTSSQGQRKQPSPKRSGSTLKGFRTASSQYLRPSLVKQKTSAFMEGIQHITAEKSAKTAQMSGWMHKRGGVGSWKARYFTLHGTRLSYFGSMKDDKERGLIDITGHRAVPLEADAKFMSLLAASIGAGRYCFKIVPPGPGYKKGVSFTPPKTHFFAVETADEMNKWMAALLKATIERDESSPAVLSCTTPTVSLPRAQEMLAEKAALEAELRDDDAVLPIIAATTTADSISPDTSALETTSLAESVPPGAGAEDVIKLMDRI